MKCSQNSVISSIRSSSRTNVQFCLNASVRMAMLLITCFILCYLNANGENILTPEEQSKLDTVHYTCALGTDVRYEHIIDALKKIYDDDDDDLAKYFQCAFRLFGFVDREDKIKIAEMKTRIPSREKNTEYVEKAIDKCEHVGGPSQMKIAYEFFKCFRDSTNFADYWDF